MSEKKIAEDLSNIKEHIASLEDRINALESGLVSGKNLDLNHLDEDDNSAQYEALNITANFKSSILEANIGEYGLAWFGNIVLLFGGIFLHLFIQSKGLPLFAALVGYAFGAAMLIFANKIQKSFTYLSSIFGIFAKILLFYVTVALHFFTTNPLIENKYIGVGLLLVMVIFQIYQSIKLKSEKHSQLALLFLVISAILSNETPILLSIVTLIAAGSVYLLFRFAWTKTLIFSILLVYFSFLIWLLGNPFMNHGVNIVANIQFDEFYLFAISGFFSMILFTKKNESFRDSTILSAIILNFIGFSFILLLLTLSFFKENYQVLFSLISIFSIALSIILNKYSARKYSASVYALYGFVAISITFYGIFKIPMIFLILSIQSLLVLSMALWFRSKIIVVMNTFMLLTLAIIYFGFIDSVNSINFSFPIVAAISARVINWQHKRLSLNSDSIRNIYLIILFFSMLYALKKVMPSDYVTLSWSITALVYFVVSVLMKNRKYRHLAIGSLGAAAIYLLFVDLETINVIYRIIAFLVLAIISIGISVYYVGKSNDETTPNS